MCVAPPRRPALPRLCLCLCLGIASYAFAELDKDSNGLSDVWESRFNAVGLDAGQDADLDGFTNQQEAVAGTNPLDAQSFPALDLRLSGANVQPTWLAQAGKRYQLYASDSLASGSWSLLETVDGEGTSHATTVAVPSPARFFRVRPLDMDTDGDGLTNWEERLMGYDPFTAHTDRYDATDFNRTDAAWNSVSTVHVALVDGNISERWPDPGVIAIRRSGGTQQITVNLSLGGTATLGSDYTSNATTSVVIPPGVREVWVEITPVADSLNAENSETVIVTALAGAGYTLGSSTSATVNLANQNANGPPSAKEAARFLVQAAFGPDQDSPADPDNTPENVEQVMALGFEGWIDAEFAKPATKLQPFTAYVEGDNIPEFYADGKIAAWWSRAMGVSPAVPGGPAVQYDMLRQRVAFCLSQIAVVSDRPEVLAVEYVGMANYYDTLIDQAFGNYRTLLYNVTRHPVMGFYLSALKNQKPDPANNIFPDENYAREIMQLFSIGLWMLHQDGSRQVDDNDNFIPTYNNTDITNFARVFTGMSFAGGGSFEFASNNWTQPMKLWDAYHDCDPKTLLLGATLPARTPSNPDLGTAANLDLNAAIDNLFNHPNVGPFIARQLIQRMVTSNPGPGYIGRVAAKFANNGSGVRGDMKAVVRAILLDDEARNPAHMANPIFGKVREPFLRVVNFGRAFNAASTSGFYQLGNFFMDHYEEPMKSPSVFNFYLPHYTPPGEIQTAGLVAPEFQVVNATSAITAPNYYYNAVFGGLERWGAGNPARAVMPNTTQELAMVQGANPPIDALLERLDLALCYGSLSPRLKQTIREAVLRIDTSRWDYARERLRLAIYIIVTSPEFCVLR
jgi:uncharacterized protein (DUF1800 family)